MNSIKRYLESEFKEGKDEFRIFINADGSFYIHPMNKSGHTYDDKIYLSGF